MITVRIEILRCEVSVEYVWYNDDLVYRPTTWHKTFDSEGRVIRSVANLTSTPESVVSYFEERGWVVRHQLGVFTCTPPYDYRWGDKKASHIFDTVEVCDVCEKPNYLCLCERDRPESVKCNGVY